jgi:hypothetical protein
MSILDFIKDRARHYNCPVCGHGLERCDVRMLQQAGNRYTVQVTCVTCQVQFVVILEAQEEVAEEAVVTAPAPLAPEAEPIAADELLDVHLALRDFTGPLTDLIRQPSADRR